MNDLGDGSAERKRVKAPGIPHKFRQQANQYGGHDESIRLEKFRSQ